MTDRCRRCNKTASQHYGIARCYKDEDVQWLPPIEPVAADRLEAQRLEERLREAATATLILPFRVLFTEAADAIAQLRAEMDELKAERYQEEGDGTTQLEQLRAERDLLKRSLEMLCKQKDQ